MYAHPMKTVAAVDLGSNSFHMIVAKTVEGGFHTVDRMREMVRLGGGFDTEGNLTPEACARAIACLERFGQRLRELPPGAVRAVGTNALRQAKNANSFLRRAREALGHPIEVIAGREEARLIYLGVSHSLPEATDNRIVIDIGGGSTEFILGKGFETKHRESLLMGCVSYSLRFFSNGVVTASAMQAAETAAAQELRVVRPRYRAIGWQTAIGSSGTIRAIQEILLENHWSSSEVTRSGLLTLREKLISSEKVEGLRLPGLDLERVSVLPGGLAILNAAFVELGIEQLTVSEGALREGLLYDLLGRFSDGDIRKRSVQILVNRYHIDLPQAKRVEQTTLLLFEQVKEECALQAEEHQHMLSWGALLHELGLTIAHASYHKHGAYVISNSDMPGFSRSEQQFLGALVRGHRRRFPIDLLKQLPEGQFENAWKLCVLLRLAVLLHRDRSSSASLPLLSLQCKPNKQTLYLAFPEGWLDCHPLTRADLEEETAHLKVVGLKLRID
ncbi:Exopolyphosphatase [Gammaproteobacteria bacterium]